MFVDDSGKTRPHRAGSGGISVHILAGPVVHESGIDAAGDEIDDAKRAIFAGSDPVKWELHAYDVWNNRAHSLARSMPSALRKREIFSRMVEAIVGSGASLLSVVVWKNRLQGGLDGPCTRALARRLPEERFRRT